MTIAIDVQALEARAGGVPGPARPATPAHVIRDDAEAIAIAKSLAAQFREGASQRDLDHVRPLREVDAFSQSGLWSINVPRSHGGPEVSYRTLARVIAIISAADPSIGQIAQNHLGIVAAIRTVSDEAQKALLFGEVLKGVRFGNAFSERGTKRAADFETHFTDRGDHVVVRGRKFYSTGALLAHLVPIVAVDDENRAWYAIADRDAPGLTVIDDWSSFGQRGTASGTVLIEDVRVPKSHLVPAWKGYEGPRSDGAVFQIIQAAIDAGIGRAALDDTIAFVREKARPWIDSGQERPRTTPTRSRPSETSPFGSTPPRRCSTRRVMPSTSPSASRVRRASRRRSSRSPKPKCSPRRSRSPPPTNCSNSPAPVRLSRPRISTGTGATQGPTRCTIRCVGNTPSSATTPSTA